MRHCSRMCGTAAGCAALQQGVQHCSRMCGTAAGCAALQQGVRHCSRVCSTAAGCAALQQEPAWPLLQCFKLQQPWLPVVGWLVSAVYMWPAVGRAVRVCMWAHRQRSLPGIAVCGAVHDSCPLQASIVLARTCCQQHATACVLCWPLQPCMCMCQRRA